MAGAKLLQWSDGSGQNKFGITDVHGFNDLGGTKVTQQYNFFIRYRGTISHPGGNFSLREENDSIEDAVWVFIGDKVGSSNTNDLFLEVHGFFWPLDLTADAPSVSLPAGDIPIDIILVRCAKQIEPVDVQIAIGSAGFTHVGNAPSKPYLGEDLFPPAL